MNGTTIDRKGDRAIGIWEDNVIKIGKDDGVGVGVVVVVVLKDTSKFQANVPA